MSEARELVLAARGAAEPDGKRAAQRRITQLGSLRVARAIIDGSAEDRLALWRDHVRREPLAPAIVPVVLAAIGVDGAAAAGEALDRARHLQRGARGDDEVIAIAALAEQHAAALPLRELLAIVEWGLEDAAAWLRGDGAGVAGFVAAAVGGLAAATPAALEEVRWSGGLQRALVLAATHTDGAAVIDRWLAEPRTAALVTQAWFDAHGQLERHGDSGRLVALVAPAWDRARERAVLAGALAEATARHRGSAGLAALADWAWSRLAIPDERALVYRAFRPWRDALLDRRNAAPRAQRPGGDSAVEHLAVWGGLDREHLGATIDEAVRLARPADWPALVDVGFALAADAPDRTAQVWGLVGVARLGHEVANRLRDRERAAAPEEVEAALRWRDRAAALARHLRDEGLVLDRDLASRAEDLESIVALVDRERDRRAENLAEEARRAAERARRAEDERRRAEDERRRAEDEARRAAAARAAEEAHLADLAARTAATAHLQPVGPLEPLDREPFFGKHALPTLVDYARAMVRLQRGADVMALFAELGLDATSWAACVQAWSQLFVRRPELAQRFGALLSGPWA